MWVTQALSAPPIGISSEIICFSSVRFEAEVW